MPGLFDLSKDQQEEMDFIIRTFDRDYTVFREHYDEIEDGYNYLAGIQYKKDRKTWLDDQRRPARVFNLILPSFNVTLGDFLLNELDVKVFPQPGGTAELAQTFQRIIDHINIDNDVRSVFQDTALAGLLKSGFLHVRYTDEKHLDGSVVIDNTDEFEIMWETSARHYMLDDSEWIIRSNWKDKNEILSKIGSKKRAELERLLVEKEDLQENNLSQTAIRALHNRDFVNERDDGRYRIIEFNRMRFEESEVAIDPVAGFTIPWDMEGKKADLFFRRYPDARIVRGKIKKKTVTEMIPGLYYWIDKRDADIQDQEHDYIHFSAFHFGRTTFNNFSMFRNIKDPQDDLNDWRNNLNNLIAKMINPGHLYRADQFEKPEQVETAVNAAGVALEVTGEKPFNEIIQSLGDHLTKLPFSPDTLSQEAAEFLQRIANVTNALYGTQESASEPASLFAQKVNRALVAFQGTYGNWSRTKRRLYNKVIRLVQKNMTHERYFLITDPKTETTEELFLNWQIGDQVLNDVTQGRYKVTTNDIDRHPTARFAQFRQKTEVVQMVVQMFGGAIANPQAILPILTWWLSDTDLGDINEFLAAFGQALTAQGQQQAEAVQQQEAFGIVDSLLDLANKDVERTTGEKANTNGSVLTQ